MTQGNLLERVTKLLPGVGELLRDARLVLHVHHATTYATLIEQIASAARKIDDLLAGAADVSTEHAALLERHERMVKLLDDALHDGVRDRGDWVLPLAIEQKVRALLSERAPASGGERKKDVLGYDLITDEEFRAAGLGVTPTSDGQTPAQVEPEWHEITNGWAGIPHDRTVWVEIGPAADGHFWCAFRWCEVAPPPAGEPLAKPACTPTDPDCTGNCEACPQLPNGGTQQPSAGHPTTHHLKAWPEPFQAVASGIKRFEFRRNDRYFCVGDTLALEEWEPTSEQYTGAAITVRVSYVLYGPAFGIPEGYCIMSIVLCEQKPSAATESEAISDEGMEPTAHEPGSCTAVAEVLRRLAALEHDVKQTVHEHHVRSLADLTRRIATLEQRDGATATMLRDHHLQITGLEKRAQSADLFALHCETKVSELDNTMKHLSAQCLQTAGRMDAMEDAWSKVAHIMKGVAA